MSSRQVIDEMLAQGSPQRVLVDVEFAARLT